MYPLCPYHEAWNPGRPEGTLAGGAMPGPTVDVHAAVNMFDDANFSLACPPELLSAAGAKLSKTAATSAVVLREIFMLTSQTRYLAGELGVPSW
jgi:hypothetical protein